MQIPCTNTREILIQIPDITRGIAPVFVLEGGETRGFSSRESRNMGYIIILFYKLMLGQLPPPPKKKRHHRILPCICKLQ